MPGGRIPDRLKAAAIIPARLGSERFPRKLLAPVLGKPLVLWTAEAVRKALPDLPLFFAVDGDELGEVLAAEGYQTVRTDPALPSGSDRIAAANREIGAETILNVQADEPAVDRAGLLALLERVASGAEMGTLATPFHTARDFLDPNQVKVLVDAAGDAIYFSRAPLPFRRGDDGPPTDQWVVSNRCLRHLGVYAYRSDFLERFVSLPPSPLEQAERLEQLRAVQAGYRIAVVETAEVSVGVDTPEDLVAFEALVRAEDRR